MVSVNEVWKPVKGSNGFYEVSNLGRVKSTLRSMTIVRRGYKDCIMQRQPKMLKPRMNRDGYMMVYIGGPIRRSVTVHSLVASAFIGDRPAGHDVNHKNCIKRDNTSTNLEYATRRANVVHAHNAGLFQSRAGVRNPACKLTDRDVISIKRRLGKDTGVDLARKFGVSVSTISLIKRGKHWKHLSVPVP